MARTSQRPENHNQEESSSRPERVNQLSPACVHDCIGDKESRIQIRELRVRNRNVELNGSYRHRQSLPVQVAYRDSGAKEEGYLPPQ